LIDVNTTTQEKAGRIRVLQLGSPIGLYGAERWILALANHLEGSRVETWIATIRDAPNLQATLSREEEAGRFPKYAFDCPGRLNFSAIPLLRKFIRDNAIDILHTHGYKTDLIGLGAVRGTRCKIVTTPHGWTAHPDLKLRCYEWLDRLSFPFFYAVVPLSDEILRRLHSIPGLKKKLHLIRNGVDVGEVDRVTEIADEIRELKQHGAFIIGYVGRFTPGKALDVLLKAVAQAGQVGWRVAFVGEGEQEQELKELVRDVGLCEQVSFFGYRKDRLAFLKGFDLFVLPSRSEGISRSIMEAMIAGVPVVASDIPGCRQIITPGETGLLVPLDQPAALADAIRKMAGDPGFRAGIARKARENIVTHFSASRMGKEYGQLFHSLVSPAPFAQSNKS
jgi:glycosyltransferase involved in cell wall biosynthesis